MPTTFDIIRDCCTSGNCFICSRKTPFGTPVRVVHASNVTKAYADKCAVGWKAYNVVVHDRPRLKLGATTHSVPISTLRRHPMLNSDEVKEAIDVLDEIISEIEAMQTTEGSETERLVSTSLSSMYDAQKHLRALHIALTTEA